MNASNASWSRRRWMMKGFERENLCFKWNYSACRFPVEIINFLLSFIRVESTKRRAAEQLKEKNSFHCFQLLRPTHLIFESLSNNFHEAKQQSSDNNTEELMKTTVLVRTKGVRSCNGYEDVRLTIRAETAAMVLRLTARKMLKSMIKSIKSKLNSRSIYKSFTSSSNGPFSRPLTHIFHTKFTTLFEGSYCAARNSCFVLGISPSLVRQLKALCFRVTSPFSTHII